MTHKIHGNQIHHPYKFIDVELIPANEKEQQAIINVRNLTASQEEKDLVENYLLFRLNTVGIESQNGNRLVLKSSNV